MIITSPIVTIDTSTGDITYGQTPCPHCGHGHAHWGIPAGRDVAFHKQPCKPCKGTGKRGNGHCRKCSDSYQRSKHDHQAGMVTVVSLETAYDNGPCGRCMASGTVTATRYDYAPATILPAIFAGLDITIAAREQSSAERLFGTDIGVMRSNNMTSLGGWIDHGRRWDAAVAAYRAGGKRALDLHLADLAMDVRADLSDSTCQMVGFITPDDRLIGGIIAYLGTTGISVYGYTPATYVILKSSIENATAKVTA